jgi:cysteine desulfurase
LFFHDMRRIFLDQINGSPLLPEVQQAIAGLLARAANPSGLHAEGREAARLRDLARSEVAELVGARAEEVTFTSSGSEANQWALMGLAEANRTRGNHLILSSVEHASLLQSARRLEKSGWGVTLLPVDSNGWVHPDSLEQALSPKTVLISVQWANPEVGTLQPIAELARRAKARNALVHCDAVAAAGQVRVDFRDLPLDALSLAAHPMGAPPGAGALVLRKGVRIWPLLVGGTQEEGRRAGTENLLGIVGMGAAAQTLRKDLEGWGSRITPLRDRLFRGILKGVPDALLHGHPTERLPGHLSLSIPGLDAESLVLALDLEGVALGLGSACTSLTQKASHVLRAMGVEESLARGAVTCTLGLQSREEEIDQVEEILPRAVAGLRKRVKSPS